MSSVLFDFFGVIGYWSQSGTASSVFCDTVAIMMHAMSMFPGVKAKAIKIEWMRMKGASFVQTATFVICMLEENEKFGIARRSSGCLSQ